MAQHLELHADAGEAGLRALCGEGVCTPEAWDEALTARPAPKPRSLTLARHYANTGCGLLRLFDADYPRRIRDLLPSPPPVLYYRGNLELLQLRAISIIGTRRPSAPGRSSAAAYAAALVDDRTTIVSGNAPGIDSAAHQAAVSAGGSTIVFCPAALDQFVPGFTLPTDDRYLVISRFVPGTPTAKYYFHGRNDLVAAHAGCAIVAETGTRGGTLNTVGTVRRLGHPLFAVALPPEARHYEAYRLLVAGGARPLPPEPDASALQTIRRAADLAAKNSRVEVQDLFHHVSE